MAGSYAKISTVVASELIVASTDSKSNIPMAVVITSKRGSLEPEHFLGDKAINRFKAVYGKSDLKYGKSNLYAQYLIDSATDNLLVVRAVSDSSKYAGVLVKGKIDTEILDDVNNIKLDPVVSGINGIYVNDLDKFQFPVYSRDAEYSSTKVAPANYIDPDNTNVMYLDDVGEWKEGDRVAKTVGGVPGSDLYTIKTISGKETYGINKVEVTVTSAANGDNSSETITQPLKLVSASGHEEPVTNIKVDDNINNTAGATLILTLPSTDLYHNGDAATLKYDDGTTVSTVEIGEKSFYTEDLMKVEFDRLPVSFYGYRYVEQLVGTTEFRDVALVIPKGTGVDGNKLSVEITDSTATESAFTLNIYYDGVLVEAFTCSPKYEEDGNGVQINVEQVVNNNSNYVKWVVNKGMVDENGESVRPLNSDHARWLRNPEPVYILRDGTNGYDEVKTVEDVNPGDVEVKLNSVDSVTLGDRFIFQSFDGTKSKEYKVKEISSGDVTITLDRPLEDAYTIVAGTHLAIVDLDYNDPENDIYNGYQKFKVLELPTSTPNYLGKPYKVGDYMGVILDAGANNMAGGSDGQSVKVTELISALHKIQDAEKYHYFFLGDAGFTSSEFQTELIKVAKSRVTTHAFLSSKLDSEYASDVVGAVLKDFNDLHYTDYCFSFSTDWYYTNDLDNNRTDVLMPPSLSDLLVEAGAINTDGIWTAAAGWRKGKYFNNGLLRSKSLGEREYLYKYGVNASKEKAYKGVAKFSEITGLNQDRPLLYRSIAKLVIYVVYNLQNYLEDIHFEAYDDTNIDDVTGDIEDFLDNILSAGGIYSSKVVIGDLVNDTTVNKRKLPIYVAINGKAFFQGVTLALDVQQGMTTEVNLAYAQTLTA